MAIPENAKAIYTFLVAAGLSDNAAAGIVGNIEQESGGVTSAGGNPPGSGLIQQLGFPSTDTLAQNEAAILTYIKANGSIADINAHASSPSAAALYFSEQYERPLASAANNPNRETSAEEVAQAAASGKWPSDSNPTTTAATSSNGLFSFPSEITGFFSDADSLVTKVAWLAMPASWLRIVAFLAGAALLLVAAYAFIAVSQGQPILPKAPAVIPVPV